MGKTFTPELHLEGEYLKFFRKVKRNINSYTGTMKSFDDIEADIGEMFYTAQKDGKLLKDIIGENEDEYILELIRTFYDVSSKKKNISFKIGSSIVIASDFAFTGFLTTGSIIVSILAASIGVAINIKFFKNINEGLDIKAIKYMKVMNNITIISFPIMTIGIFMGYAGQSEKIFIGILLIGVVGTMITQIGNYENKKSS
ncbi:MAG: hypothetical protein ACRC68_05850 [Clostridium sp.]